MFKLWVIPTFTRTTDRALTKKKLWGRRAKETEIAAPPSVQKRIQTPAQDAMQRGLFLGPTFTKMREASLKAPVATAKKKKIVDDESGPFTQLLWSTKNGLRKTILSFNENQFQRYLLNGPRGLGPKYELGVPFHEYLYGPVEKAMQDPVVTPVPQTSVPQPTKELSSTKKKRVWKMKKHKYKKRLKEGRKERRLNK